MKLTRIARIGTTGTLAASNSANGPSRANRATRSCATIRPADIIADVEATARSLIGSIASLVPFVAPPITSDQVALQIVPDLLGGAPRVPGQQLLLQRPHPSHLVRLQDEIGDAAATLRGRLRLIRYMPCEAARPRARGPSR